MLSNFHGFVFTGASSPGDSSSQQRSAELERSVSPEVPSKSAREN